MPNDALGGAEKKLKQIAIVCLDKGYSVDVYFLKKRHFGGWDDLSDKANLFFTKFSKERFGIFALFVKLKGRKYTFSFSSNTGVNGFLGIMKRLRLLSVNKIIVRESTQLLDRFTGLKTHIFRFLYRFGYSATDLVVCQTSFMKERLYHHLPYATSWNVKVIPNPVNTKEVIDNSLEDINIDQFGNYLLGVGRLIELKGFDLLIKSLVNLPDDINLVLVGDGGYESSLKDLAVSLDLQERVFFVGYQSNPYPYMKNAKCCIISSRVEGFPNTLLQMMTVNNNCISTLCAGDIDKLDGVLTCETDSVQELQSTIEDALEFDVSHLQNNRKLYDLELGRRSPADFVQKMIEYVG